MTLHLLGAAAASLLGMGALEAVLHRRRLAAIPTRVHVAGTRGKSSVTRLVAAGLRHAGVRTLAKTTGSLPSLVTPDGSDVPIERVGGANILEQADVVRAAQALGAEALVVECMALDPELHWLCESRLIRATHAIITNARADHLDVMGPTEADVARCLAGMVPIGGVLVTSDERHAPIFEAACSDRGARLRTVSPNELAAIDDDALSHFAYVEHRENVAVALALLDELGVAGDVALEGMWGAAPDPGALTEHELDYFGRRIVFVNAFAANDPDSTARVWTLARTRHADVDRVVAVFNLRDDRPERTKQLARAARFWHDAADVVLFGEGASLFAREAVLAGVAERRLHVGHGETREAMFESVLERCGRSTLVIGMGNIAGPGFELARLFKNRQTLAPPAVRIAGSAR